MLLLQVYLQKYLVDVVLLNPKVALCDLEGGMVEYLHQDGRLHPHLPGMVAKRLAQAVAADILLKMQRPPGRAQDTVGLAAAQRPSPAPPGEEERPPCHSREAVPVGFQGLRCISVQRILRLLAGLALGDGDMLAEPAVLKVIDVVPGQGQQVADPQGRIDPHTHHSVIAQIAFLIKEIILQCSDIFGLSNWLSCTHLLKPPVLIRCFCNSWPRFQTREQVFMPPAM